MSINTLPNELLSMVFKYETEPESEGLAPTLPICIEGGLVDMVSILTLTHVCRLWRSVALGDPTLWTRVDSLHQAQMDAFLERSQNLPVSLCVRAGPSDFADVVESLPAVRLRRLDLELDPLPRDMDPLTRLHAPNLECLTISSDKDGSSEGVLLHRPQLLSNEVLHLKALAVQPAMSWMPSNYFPALTHLHLSFGPNQPESLCVYDVLPLLSNTPQLQFAHIAGILYSWMRMPSTATVLPIALPRLRSLTCSCWAHVQVVRLLALLELPERCWVRLQDIAIDPSGEGYPAPVPQLALMSHTTHLEIASSPEHLLLVSEGKSSGFWIETHIDDGSATWNHWLAQLDSTMPLANITSLHANIHSEQHLFWPAVLRHMPRLSRFDVVVGSFVPGHAHPLSILCGLLSRTPVLIPALRELRLQLVENTHSSFHPTPPLLCILESRGHLGCRLHRLAVQLHATEPESDTLGQELAAALSGYVDVFELVSPLEPPLCEFKMRDVWRVEGSEVYWKPDDLGEPCYSLPAF